MSKYIDPFLYGIPRLDLHGENRYSATILVKMFILENVRLCNERVLIIHGKGLGILMKEVHEYLKKDSNVISFSTNNYNDGETIVYLKISR